MLARTITPRIALLLLITSALSVPAHAERVYQLVNYPALQYGHTLTGTITTSDAAPDDGMLSTSEILDWQWKIHGAGTWSASYAAPTPGLPTTFAQGIAISPTSIEMPRIASVQMRLEESADNGQPQGAPGLRWFTYFDGSQGMYAFRSLAFVVVGGDIPMTIWSSELVSTGDANWIVATAVPEPASIWFVLPLLLFGPSRPFRNRGRICIKFRSHN